MRLPRFPFFGSRPLDWLFPLACLIAARLATGTQEPAAPRPVFINETLRFTTSVFGITGGQLVLSGREDTLQGRKVYRGEFQAVSSDLLSKFFLVRDWIATWMDPGSFRSLRFEKHSVEGKRVRDEWMELDWKARVARGELNGEAFEVRLPDDEPAFDMLSTIFFVRTLTLEPSAPVRELRYVSRKGVATIRIRVHARETVKVPAGTFQTLRVEPTAGPEAEGLIGKGRNLILWMTDDARHMPVQIRSKLKTGTLVARLVSVERGDSAPPPTPPPPPTPTASPTPLPTPIADLRL